MNTMIAKSDSQIKADVLNELKWDTAVDETQVGVQVHNGIVTLTGNLSSYTEKLAAREAAHRVYGVLDLVDSTQIKIPSVWERTDEDIAKAVRTALKWDVLVPDEHITSTVSNGLVTLRGNVDTWMQRFAAERALHRFAGVKGISNQITVTAQAVNANQIKDRIEGALQRQAQHEAKHIAVSVKDGVVTLTGSVRSWAERNAVERAAGYGLGVRRVEDKTVVDPYC